MKKLMAANWKMHMTRAEAIETAAQLALLTESKLPKDREVLVLPPFTALETVGGTFKDKGGFSWGAQNFYPAEKGAFTGEISSAMLADLGCTYLLAGHSERRHVLGEDDTFVGEKVGFGLEKGFRVILCVGETIEQRRAGKVADVLATQLHAGLVDVQKGVEPERVSIAYEPVWAIGTGEVAGPDEIVQAHDFVRDQLRELFGRAAGKMRILYGGSVKPANAADILSLDNVNGVLVGGASLAADSFSAIALAGL